MRKALLLAAAASLVTATAHAALIKFNVTGYGGKDPNAPFEIPYGISLTITDAQIASGSFVLSGGPHSGFDKTTPISYTGDYDAYQGLSAFGETASKDYLFGSINLAFAFANGQVTSSLFDFSGVEAAVDVSGSSGSSAAGTYGTETSSCVNGSGGKADCTVQGYWTVVPEPASAALLAVPLFVAWRRRQSAIVTLVVPPTPAGDVAHTRNDCGVVLSL